MLGVSVGDDGRYHSRGDDLETGDDLSRLAEPPHMGVARGEKAVRRRVGPVALQAIPPVSS